MAKSDLDKRMAERRARVEAAREEESTKTDARACEPEGDIDDYWTLPKTGAPTTLLNSAWTWTLIIYVVIMGAAVTSMATTGLPVAVAANSNIVVITIAVALLYPAWRIGYLISKYLKRRGIGGAITSRLSDSLKGAPKADKAKPGSVEARMAERRARLEKAREEGKI